VQSAVGAASRSWERENYRSQLGGLTSAWFLTRTRVNLAIETENSCSDN
jgi:hypothetical protein